MPDLSCCEGLGYRLRGLESGELRETEIDLGFTAADWAGGQILKVIRAGVPVLGEIGPHSLPIGTYNVSVFKFIDEQIVREVRVNILVNRSSGQISLYKSGLVPAFSGRVVINYARH